MPFVSYAQNFEDVILWRALKHVDFGCYIDVGAQDPVIDSVSLAFYERGWRGVHVEPVASYAEMLCVARPDEEVIQSAISTRKKDILFYEIPDTGLSTGDRRVAQRHRKQGYTIREVSVSCMPLSVILDKYQQRDVHWLKIDTEGMEAQAIRSWAPSRVRPWIVVVESTEPNRPKDNFGKWEPTLIKLGYEFVYFDGLNRFYVSRKHPELKSSFGPGPNVFDDFVVRSVSDAANSRVELVERRAESARLAEDVERLRVELAGRSAGLAQLTNAFESTSAALKSELAIKGDTIAARDQEVAALRDEKVGLENDASNLRDQLSELQAESDEHSKALDRLRTEYGAQAAGFARATSSWKSASADLSKALTAKSDALADKNEMLAVRDGRIEALDAETTDLGRQLRESSEETLRLTLLVDNFARETSDLRAQLAESTNRALQLMLTAKELRAEAANQLAIFAEAASSWKSSNEALREDLSLKNERMANRDREIASLDAQLLNTRQKSTEVLEDIERRKQLEVSLEQELHTLREQLAGLHQSTSWRVTVPIRFVGQAARRSVHGIRSVASRLGKIFYRIGYGTSAWLTLKAKSRPHRVIGYLIGPTSEPAPFEPASEESASARAKPADSLTPGDRIRKGTASASRQLLVDVSATSRMDLRTGIQRVVKARLLTLLDSPPRGFRVEPVYLSNANNGWQYLYAKQYLAKLLSLSGNDSIGEAVEISEGDIFFSPDLFVGGVVQATAEGLYADWRARGVQINFLIHDLLPLSLPHHFPAHVESDHGKWLDAIAEASHRLICVSRAVADDTIYWLQRRKPDVLPHLEIAVSHSGADIDAFDASSGLPSNASSVLNILSSRTSFLMVGTIEPRKGHLQALRAFEQLWSEGREANLVIVGFEGWAPETARLLRAHPELGKRLLWLDGISDEYLNEIYAACDCLIAASEGEGFGLPLIEAARHNLPIIARDIPVFREVASKHASYFSGADPSNLAQAIENWLGLYAESRHPLSDEIPWVTWIQSTERLKLILLGEDMFASWPRRERTGIQPEGIVRPRGFRR